MKRILLADDHPFIMAGVEALLSQSGFSVVGKVENGAQVLQALPTLRPDILVLDVRMPERDGVEVLLTLRSRGDLRPIILLTASLDDRRLLDALKAEVNGIVLKEGAEETLLQCLTAISAGKRWIQPDLLQRALDLSIDGGGANDALSGLSTRERALARLVAQGLKNRAIAVELGVTEGTVKAYLHNIYQKLGVENRTELGVLAANGREV
jgi:two-component system nitrate/nitrite response regulator NarP